MFDALGMDGTDDLTSPDAVRPARPDHADIKARFAAVLQPPVEEPVDVSAYLLHPPPSAAELERRDRRRLVVRWGSLAAAGVLGVILLVPMPGGGDVTPVGPDGSGARVEQVADDSYPQRVDVPLAPARRPTATRVKAPANAARATVARPVATTVGRRPAAAAVHRQPVTRRPPAATRAPQAGSQQGVSSAQSASSAGTAPAPANPVAPPNGEGVTSSTDAPTVDEGVGTSGSGGSSG